MLRRGTSFWALVAATGCTEEFVSPFADACGGESCRVEDAAADAPRFPATDASTPGEAATGGDAGPAADAATDSGLPDSSGSREAAAEASADPEFPTTHVLDAFNRQNGALGPSWVAENTGLVVRNQRAFSEGAICGTSIWGDPFGATQEVFVTYVDWHPEAYEVHLVLKSQGTGPCDLVQLIYSPRDRFIAVDHCAGDEWNRAIEIDYELSPGDQLGARASADGTLQMYVNGELLETASIEDYEHYDQPGFIGIGCFGAAGPFELDDFGGGEP